MKVQQNKVVALSYELEVEGTIADKAEAGQPLEYIHGTGMLLPKFEAAVDTKEVGDNFEFTLDPEDGYGAYDEKYKFDIPKSAFEVDGKVREDLLVVGNIIPMLNSSEQVIQGKVVEVKPDSVTMDFNHPMAGKTLHFSGKVENVREATDKELQNGLHGEYLPKEDCGCGCGKDDCSCGHEGEGHGDCGCKHEGEGHGDCGCKHESEGHGDCGCKHESEGHGDCGCKQ